MNNIHKINENIYITSDEEIKEGDWYENNGVIFKADDVFDEGNNPNNSNPRVTDFNNKIILTDNKDLIKDGVQAIDDEFLEWFVKNPSCEEVEIILNETGNYREFDVSPNLLYKIIIPNEEPKQIKCYCGHTTMCDCSPIDEAKQETIEEVAEIDLTILCYYDRRNPDFQIKEEYGYDKEEVEATGNFAKKDCACDNCFYGRSKLTEQLLWQQEKSYSEEEVRNLFRNYQYDSAQFAAIMEGDTDGKPTPTGWFEKFKKK